MAKKRTKNRHRKRETSLLDDYIKANRRGSREAEIEMYGHPISYTKVAENKKKYKRSRDKFRGAFECPSFFLLIPYRITKIQYLSQSGKFIALINVKRYVKKHLCIFNIKKLL